MQATNQSRKTLYISITVIFAAFLVIVGTVIYTLRNKSAESSTWVLQSYGNNVALFNGEEVIEVYGAITLDSLPEEDKRLLDSGISFLTKEEAVMAIEDYDG